MLTLSIISEDIQYRTDFIVVGIRRFMQALEKDARVYESRYMGLTQQASGERPVLEGNDI